MAIGTVLCLLIMTSVAAADIPCAARQIQGQSVVCVCNTTYCDEIEREQPKPGEYVAYTSSQAGSRFRKHGGEFHNYNTWNEDTSHTLEIDPTQKHQTIEGFGGAVTDAAGIHYTNLTAPVRDNLVKSYFGKNGIEYNMIRVPIGGSDFSTHVYAYNELPWNDGQLTNYSLSAEDFNYKIPMIQHIKSVATADVHMVATVWSPPKWMKTNEKMTGISSVKPEFYQTYANYILKFVQEYKKRGIETWGVTTTNEPSNAEFGLVPFQDLGWTPGKMAKWIVENLGPTIRNEPDIKHIKILVGDDQRAFIPVWFTAMVAENPEVLDWIDGVGVHWYLDRFTPASVLELVTKKHPTKFVIGTEACQGSMPWQFTKVSLGDWSRAQAYVDDIIQDLNYDLIGWIEWNLCLDKQGGPNWSKNFVDSPVIVFPENQEFVKQPMFYALGHFSKWIPRGSVRLDVKEKKGFLDASVGHVAFLTPRKTIVLVAHNKGAARKVRVQIGEEHAILELEKSSVTTLEMASDTKENEALSIRNILCDEFQ